jgi:uncharacterized membrane protein YfcA
MDFSTALILTAAFLAASFLYASVGHAGASGYLTAMALVGLAPAQMRPTALVLNILVASIASIKFYRSGTFSWQLFLPLAAASIPFALVGGAITLPGHIYEFALGLVLVYAAFRMYWMSTLFVSQDIQPLPLYLALISGATIGLLSGLTGTGGGIFLTPLLLFAGWATPRQASAVSAVFILVNSIAGLIGQSADLTALPSAIPIWLIAVAIGGWIGAEYGSRRWGSIQTRRALALVMIIAALKMVLT